MCENSNEWLKKDGTTDCCATCGFLSPVIPLLSNRSSAAVGPRSPFRGLCSVKPVLDKIMIDDKSHWFCDYADDIFQTLRETELKRYSMCFRSQQVGFRPSLLNLLKVASEKHNLARTTLHLAIYYLDCFMDNYTIRQDKLDLTALTCLMLAAKIEETDINMPKFEKLKELSSNDYTLDELKNVESKILSTFNFDLLRPTLATFAEHFASNCFTLDDFHIYLQNWHRKALDYSQLRERFTKSTCKNNSKTFFLPPLYNSYEEMVTALNKVIFSMVDTSLSYLKFANVPPSILAASCIAAVRQLQGVLPIWSSYLVVLTKCTIDEIAPYVDALIALYNLHLATCNGIGSAKCVEEHNSTNTLCDSPDSGIAVSDSKSQTSAEDSLDEDDDNEYDGQEYPLLAKRRRLF